MPCQPIYAPALCPPPRPPAPRPSPPQALPLPCQCLFLRLFQRKGPLFCIASLDYKEVPDCAAAATQLATAGLAAVECTAGGTGAEDDRAAGVAAAHEASSDWQQLAGLLTVPELAAVLSQRRIQAAGNGGGGGVRSREQLLAALQAHAAISPAAATALAGWLLQATGPVVQLAAAAQEAVCRLQRLFFLNEGHSLSQVGKKVFQRRASRGRRCAAARLRGVHGVLTCNVRRGIAPLSLCLCPISLRVLCPPSASSTQFLASDLGTVRYPQYAVHRSVSAFASRQELLDYEAALKAAAQLSDAMEVGLLDWGVGRVEAGSGSSIM